MVTRLLSYLLTLGVGALAGWVLDGHRGTAWGLFIFGLGPVVLDGLRALRLQRWLEQLHRAQTDGMDAVARQPAPPETGFYGVLVTRVRQLLKDFQRALGESQTRFEEMQAALQASPNGLVLLDAEGRIEWCNLTASQHFGLDAQRDQHQYVLNLVRDPAFTAYMAAGGIGQPVLLSGKQGRARALRLSVQVHSYGQGRRLMLSRDVTLLEPAEAMRRDFVANVSHEIRTPLTVLAGFVETLQTLQLSDEERRRYLDLMGQQSQRMQTLVNDLLTLSRLEGSPLPDGQDAVSVGLLMTQCQHEARSLSLLLGASSHDIVFQQQGEFALSGSPAELQSAFSNLVSNAVRYTPPQGRIEVSWQVNAQGQGEFAVQDSGPGIAPEHLPRLTERFYRVDRSRSRESGGTGLGLAIVKHVAQRHGAELRIQSQPGRGSRFSIVFPPMRVRAQVQEAISAS